MDEPPRIPDARCTWCGYDMAGLIDVPCPECGAVASPADDAAASLRDALHARAIALITRFVGLPAALGVLLAVSLFLIGAPLAVGLAAVLIGFGLPAVGAISAAPAIMLSRPWERRTVALSWVRHGWWLMLAWLVIPALVLLALMAWAILAAVGGRSSPTLLLVLIVVVPPWATVTLVGLLGWAGSWFESDRYVRHRSGARAIAIFLGAAVTLLGAIGAGTWAGLVLALHTLPRDW